MTTTTETIISPPHPSVSHAPENRLLEVRGLSKQFVVEKKKLFGPPAKIFTALDNVSFDVYRGETFGIVGESGSGKTTAVRCILRALAPSAGVVNFTNKGRTLDLARIPDRQFKPLRQEMQMVFQDPYASLNPRMTVGDIVGEPLLIHSIGTKKERVEKVADMLKRVGLLPEHMHRYPHAFSGGQRQRIGIARALILRPALVVADEAVSALDVSVQAQILDLLRELQREFHLTYLFVAHNLAVVRTFCDRVAVMYRGRIMELGTSEQVLVRPRHAYTKVLLSAVPRPDPDFKMQPISAADLTPEQLKPCEDVA
jgi:phosphonate C-P lyase system protein PhnK